MYSFILIFTLFLGFLLAFLVAYLLMLTVAAALAPRVTPGISAAPLVRFAILIPAHNEERLLPSLFASLAALRYPTDYYRVHVVADNCSDNTAQITRAAGATAHERHDSTRPGKGPALQWLLERLQASAEAFDAVIIFDADSVVSENFLQVMAARLARGQRVVQAYYAVGQPQRSPSAGLRYSALAALHYLRPQGRMTLGASAGLKGNGMLFAAPVLQRHRWSASVTEDIEQHMALLLDGERVFFAPDATVWAEMPDSLAISESQHQRWESGRLLLARRYVPQLLRAALAAWRAGNPRQACILLDAVMEHVIPPFAILVAASALLLALSLGLWSAAVFKVVAVAGPAGALAGASVALAGSALLGQTLYLFASLRLVRAPRAAYWQLIYAPVYVLWKVRQYTRALFSQTRQAWVRTTRNDPL